MFEKGTLKQKRDRQDTLPLRLYEYSACYFYLVSQYETRNDSEKTEDECMISLRIIGKSNRRVT